MVYPRTLSLHLTRQRPLVILGARGVGKTTLLEEMAGRFSNAIRLDLETAADRALFSAAADPGDTLKAISFLKNKEIRGKGTLLILDEPAGTPAAWSWFLRQAREQAADPRYSGPVLAVASSVSLPEPGSSTGKTGDPYARYRLHPFRFEEFLRTTGDEAALQAFLETPVPGYAHARLLGYFHLFTLIGGMPRVVQAYASGKSPSRLKSVYDATERELLSGLSLTTNGEKVRNRAATLFRNLYPYAATRISMNNLANSGSGSRETLRDLRALEDAFLIHLLRPRENTDDPPSRARFPRLHLLDTGLVSYFSGIQRELYGSEDINSLFDGQIARQAAAQEILAGGDLSSDTNAQPPVGFWVRDKAQSKAEVDFLLPYDGIEIPVVVKTGRPGRLRSLHQYMDRSPHPWAVRLFAGQAEVQQTETILGKKYFLLSLPYFLAGRIREHLPGFIRLTTGE